MRVICDFCFSNLSWEAGNLIAWFSSVNCADAAMSKDWLPLDVSNQDKPLQRLLTNVWYHISLISAGGGGWEWVDQDFRVSLGYMEFKSRLDFKNQNKNKQLKSLQWILLLQNSNYRIISQGCWSLQTYTVHLCLRPCESALLHVLPNIAILGERTRFKTFLLLRPVLGNNQCQNTLYF